MNFKTVKVRKILTFDEFSQLVDLVTESFFEEDDNGVISYRPQNAEIALAHGFFRYCINEEDVQFAPGETLLDWPNNMEALAFYDQYRNLRVLKQVYACAKDAADYRKEEMLQNKENEALSHYLDSLTRLNDEQSRAIAYQNKVIDEIGIDEYVGIMKRMDASAFDTNKMAEMFIQQMANKKDDADGKDIQPN